MLSTTILMIQVQEILLIKISSKRSAATRSLVSEQTSNLKRKNSSLIECVLPDAIFTKDLEAISLEC